jgi:DNA-directed RNA polymerase specialized sigma54-like protein
MAFYLTNLEDLADDISFAHNTFVEESEVNDAILLIQQLEPQGLAKTLPHIYFSSLKTIFLRLQKSQK